MKVPATGLEGGLWGHMTRERRPGSVPRRQATRATERRRPRLIEPPQEVESEVRLRDILENLGPQVMQVIVAPRGLEVAVGDTVITDPVEHFGVEANSILLAVGTSPDTAYARDLIVRAGEAGASAVVFKMRGGTCEWVDEAEQRGVALMVVSDEVRWSHLLSLLTLALSSWRHPAPQSSIAGVPLGDLFALANGIAAMVGGAVTIEDAKARVLAYSSIDSQAIDQPRAEAILGSRVRDLPIVQPYYRQLWASDGVLHVQERIKGVKVFPRLAVAVRVGKEILGSIWVVSPKRLGQEAEQLLAEAARVAALHMIHARASRDIERRVRGDSLRVFLEGQDATGSTAARLGLSLDTPLALVAFELPDVDHAQAELLRERLVDLIAMYSEAFRLGAASVAIGTRAYAVLPLAKSAQARTMRLIEEIVEHAESTLQVPLRTAVSFLATSPSVIRDARIEVDRVLRVLNAVTKDIKVATIADVRSKAVLLELRDLASRHTDLIEGMVQEMAKHDARKGTQYVNTLRAYLEAFGDIPDAARRLGVHPNTFRYRLHRLLNVFAISLEDSDERLVLELQLSLLQSQTPSVSERDAQELA